MTIPVVGEQPEAGDLEIPTAVAFVPEANACAFWRIAWPFNELRRRGHPAVYDLMKNPRADQIAAPFDVIILQRLSWTEPDVGREAIAGLHRAGKLALQECDDDMWLAREDQKSHAELGFTDVPEADPEMNRVCTAFYDGLIVSCERLRTVVQTFAPDLPIEVVPNAIDLRYWEAGLKGWHRNLTDGVTIGWAGGDRYDRDFEVLAEAWRRVARDCPEAHFVVMGHQPEPLREAVPAERFHAIQWMTFDTSDPAVPFYGVGLGEIDIGCCSVAETMFNAAKTPIKAWEMTASGAAVVGSRWLYGDVIENGVTGYLADTVDEWEAALKRLVRSKGKRRKMQRRAYRRVRERWSIEANWWRHPAAWIRIQEAARGRAEILVPEGAAH